MATETISLRDMLAVHAPPMPDDYCPPNSPPHDPRPHPELASWSSDSPEGRAIAAWFERRADRALAQWPWHYADQVLAARAAPGTRIEEAQKP